MKRIAMLALAALMFTGSTQAVASSSVSLYHKDRPAYLEEKDVAGEVYRLEKVFPALRQLEWQWRIWDGVKWSGDFILGQTLPVDKVVYLYSPPWSFLGPNPNMKAYTQGEVAHEMGHVVRVSFITEEELAEYYARRTLNVRVADYYFNTPEELFAEDFKSLWGQPGLWRKSWIPKPTEADRQWILERIKRSR